MLNSDHSYAECCHAERQCTECFYAEYYHGECNYAVSCHAENCNALCCYVECHSVRDRGAHKAQYRGQTLNQHFVCVG